MQLVCLCLVALLHLAAYSLLAYLTFREVRRCRRLAHLHGRHLSWWCLVRSPRTAAHICLLLAATLEVTHAAVEHLPKAIAQQFAQKAPPGKED